MSLNALLLDLTDVLANKLHFSSSLQDFKQLLTDGVSLVGREDEMEDLYDFEVKYGFPIHLFVDYQALMGAYQCCLFQN